MRISDWSSDVCSSDLAVERDVARHVAQWHAATDVAPFHGALLGNQAHMLHLEAVIRVRQACRNRGAAAPRHAIAEVHRLHRPGHLEGIVDAAPGRRAARQLGRASCREWVCLYVESSVVAVEFKKKKT